MPCHTEGFSSDELLTDKLNGFLDEVGVARNVKGPYSYANMNVRGWSVDRMTRALCAWCKANDVTQKSLELQIWWRDHQRADAERIRLAKAAADKERVRRAALKSSPLTNEKRSASND